MSTADLHKAQAIKKNSATSVIVHAGGQLLAEFLGINDIKGCFTKGDIGSCVTLALSALPWGKILKAKALIKVVYRAYKAFKKFVKDSKWANRILRKAESCVVNSFTPATLVLMAGGGHKQIKDIRPGDKVLATDPATGRTVARTVVATIVGTGIKHLVTVTIDTDGKTGDRTGQVTATDGHPFYVTNPHPAAGPNLPHGTFTPARDLHPGDQLTTPTGTPITVLAVATATATQTVYNLTVDTTHTYNVLTGNEPVLVHNSNPACGVDPYQVGRYSDLKAASKAGDGLDLHHVPQGKPAGQVIPGYDYPNAPAIALPRAEHARIPNLKGSYNGSSGELIAQDLENLRTYTNAPESAIEQLGNMIDDTYPGAR